MKAAGTPPQDKLLGLEIIRFVSALSVLVWHYQLFFHVGAGPVDFVRADQPFYGALRLFYEHGLYGVQVFWCISGFIFAWKYRDPVAARTVGPRTFFILRLSRLYPLHLATLLAVAALQSLYVARQGAFFVYQHNDLYNFVVQLFMASEWGFANGESFNAPIWSISVEVLVYGLFFAILRHVSRSPLVNVGVLLLCLAARRLDIHHPFVDCLAFFYAGGLASIGLEALQGTRLRRPLTLLAGALVVAVPLLLPDRVAQNRNLFLLAWVPVLLFVAAQPLRLPPRLQHLVAAAGNMTYSSYLLQFPIQLAISLALLGTGPAPLFYSPAFFVAYIAITLVAARLVYRFFELPAQRAIRRRFA
ncbi:MAG: acyltransferase [Proteobacteria bacterium]|nr:acyltransferase [Pseudomonadota bacterium]